MHRRIHVAELPLIGGELAVGRLIPLAQQQRKLLLGEIGIHHGQGDGMKRQIPGGEPRVLPLVGHGEHVVVVDVNPGPIPAQ